MVITLEFRFVNLIKIMRLFTPKQQANDNLTLAALLVVCLHGFH